MSLRSSPEIRADSMTSGLAVRFATDADAHRWDAYLDRVPLSSPLCRYGWLKVLERSYGVTTLGFIAEDGEGSIVGLLPAYVVSDFRGRNWLYSLKFGLVADDGEAARQLMDGEQGYCSQHGIARGLIHAGYSDLDTPFAQIKKNTLALEVEDSEKAEWESLRSKTRNMIRKARQNDLVVERGFDNLPDFYDIYCTDMLDKGLGIHPFSFFQAIAYELSDDSELIVARHDGRAIAGILVAFAKDAATYPFNVSLKDSHQYAPNSLLLWEALMACVERGVSLLDMGESGEGSSVYRFKKNFGGTPRDVFYYVTEAPPMRNGIDLDFLRGVVIGLPMSHAARMVSTRGPRWVRRRVNPWVRSKGRIL